MTQRYDPEVLTISDTKTKLAMRFRLCSRVGRTNTKTEYYWPSRHRRSKHKGKRSDGILNLRLPQNHGAFSRLSQKILDKSTIARMQNLTSTNTKSE